MNMDQDTLIEDEKTLDKIGDESGGESDDESSDSSSSSSSSDLDSDDEEQNDDSDISKSVKGNDKNAGEYSKTDEKDNLQNNCGTKGIDAKNAISNNDGEEESDSLSSNLGSDEDSAAEDELTSDFDHDEIDLLLEEGLPKAKRITNKLNTLEKDSKRDEYNEKEIIVLEEKSRNTLEVLPGGWIEVRHSSGMPLYLHRKTRVCTIAKPYFLGPGSVRRHSIPLSAIPCLAYRRGLEEESREAASPIQVRTSESTSVCPYRKSSDPESLGAVTSIESLNNGIADNSIAQSEKRKQDEGCTTVDSSPKRTKLTKVEVDSSQNQPSSNTPVTNGVEAMDADDMASIQSDVQKSNTDNDNNISTSSVVPLSNLIPLAKVATAKENHSMHSISPLQLRDYCKTLFKFKSVKCKRFKTWGARRKHTKEQKRIQLQRPTLPDGVKLISFPIHNGGTTPDGGKVNKEYVMNPQGKSSVCILHEYVQHALRKQPSYIFRELENAATPYSATVVINNMQYGDGFGSSKKQAKADAAKTTLEILIPQMKELDGSKKDSNGNFDILPFFEPLGLFDAGIAKVCKNFSEPPPYVLLLTCLQRNFGQEASNNVKFEMISPGTQSNKFKMEVGEHSVEVSAPNKRVGKQLASQYLLAELHPHITNFGAFVKLYGNCSVKSVKEKKQEEQQITTLQSKASANSPNWAILAKLKAEMQKLQDNFKIPAQSNPNTSIGVQIAAKASLHENTMYWSSVGHTQPIDEKAERNLSRSNPSSGIYVGDTDADTSVTLDSSMEVSSSN